MSETGRRHGWTRRAFLKSSAVGAGVIATGTAAPPRTARAATESADLIYQGGDIVTVDEARPTAEAVAVRGGKILAVGPKAEVMTLKGPKTRVIDLKGQTLVPGFIDAHGHLFTTGVQALAANLLAPPDGDVKDLASLQAKLREWAKLKAASRLGWLIGFGYDDAQLREQRHPTKEELDAVSGIVPILAIHQSAHLATVNSKALELARITATTANPPGGVIRRNAGSQEPDGVLEESAFWMVLGALPKLTDQDNLAIVKAGHDLYVRFGFTTAQEGRATPGIVKTLEQASRGGQLRVDVACYPDVAAADAVMRSASVGRSYTKRFRIAGVKLNVDGSPQGKTAWLTQPYFKPPAGQKDDYVGYPALTDEQAMALVEKAFANNWQILAHVNGDAAIDQYIRAVRAASAKHPGADRRPVAIHAQTVRADQLDAFKELGIVPALFPMHTFYWGDWHRDSVLGPERAAFISPMRAAIDRGLMPTSHHDAPVAFPDSMRVLSATVTRRTRSGQVLGPDQRVTPLEALKAMTLWAARQHFEEETKGSIAVGKLADFVILSANPTTIDPLKLADIKVLATIKEGVTVYRAGGGSRAAMDEEAQVAALSCVGSAPAFESAAASLGAITGAPLCCQKRPADTT